MKKAFKLSSNSFMQQILGWFVEFFYSLFTHELAWNDKKHIIYWKKDYKLVIFNKYSNFTLKCVVSDKFC